MSFPRAALDEWIQRMPEPQEEDEMEYVMACLTCGKTKAADEEGPLDTEDKGLVWVHHHLADDEWFCARCYNEKTWTGKMSAPYPLSRQTEEDAADADQDDAAIEDHFA